MEDDNATDESLTKEDGDIENEDNAAKELEKKPFGKRKGSMNSHNSGYSKGSGKGA